MEVIIIIVVFWLIVCAVRKASSGDTQHSTSSNPFVFSISEKIEQGKDYNITCLDFSISGGVSLSSQRNLAMIHLVLKATDKNGKEWPVFTEIKTLAANDGEFLFVEALPLPYQHNVFRNPVSFLTVPERALSFPCKGSFHLRATLIIGERKYSGGSWIPIVTKTSKIKITSNEFGYQDRAKHREITAEVAVKLATLMSRTCGSAVPGEANVIKEYIVQKINWSSSRKEEIKRRLNDAVREAFATMSVSSGVAPAIDGLCEKCKGFPLANKLDIVELLLRVIVADNEATPGEMELLEKIIHKMDVDFDEYKKLRDKMIDIKKHGAKLNTRAFLGITDDMSEEQIRKLLNDEYRKWNSMQNSPDAEVREKAQKMIRLIAEERAKLRAQ